MMKRNKARKGLTLTEVIITVAVLGILVFMGKVGVIFVNNMLQASAMSKVQQEAQLALYSITKEVRNCRKIVSASSSTLTLQMLNTSLGFDVTMNPNLFNIANISTLTYTYTKSGNESYLLKTLVRSGVVVENKKILRNILLTPNATQYMFNVCDNLSVMLATCPIAGTSGAAVEPYEAVDIRFRMSPSFTSGVDILYSAKEMRRSNAQ